jgi:hypothetical protein
MNLPPTARPESAIEWDYAQIAPPPPPPARLAAGGEVILMRPCIFH